MSNNSKTILLVEDEAIIAILHKRSLSKYGFNVITADTGEKAVEIAHSTAPIDLILMDINLGDGIDGTEAAERILNIRNIPLVFLSSHTEPEIVNKTEGITSYGYIVKNSGETVLLASIRMAFKLFDAHIKNETYSRNLEKINIELVRSENDYKILFESSPSGIFIAKDNYIKFINSAGQRIIGYAASELIANPFITFIHPDDISMVVERYQKRLKGEEVETGYCLRIISSKCDIRWIRVTSTVIVWGDEPATLNHVIDVTEQKLAEETANAYRKELESANEKLSRTASELKESEEKFRNLAESIPVAIMMYQNDKWIYANPAAERISGYTSSELMNMNFWEFAAPEFADKVKAMGSKRQNSEKAEQQYEFKIISKNGTDKWVHLYGTSVIYNGNSAGLISVIDTDGINNK